MAELTAPNLQKLQHGLESKFTSVSSLPSDPLFGLLSQAEQHLLCKKTAEAGIAQHQSHSTGFREERRQNKTANAALWPASLWGARAPRDWGQAWRLDGAASASRELGSALEMNPTTELTPLLPLWHPLSQGSRDLWSARCAKPQQH